MKKYDTTNYFYLMDRKEIKKEEINSGATLFNNKWYTNFKESNSIEIKENNKLSIYVPSTINVNEINTNVKDTINKVKKAIKENTQEYHTQGAWKSEDGKIVYEEICILTIDVNESNFKNKLDEFIKIANELKIELTQEGISIGVNNGLLII